MADEDQMPEVGNVAPDGLLTGDEQWWQFLDRKTSEGEPDAPAPGDRSGGGEADGGVETDLELQDVSRPSYREAGLTPTTHSFRCSNCRGDNPADLPFCVHCGASPPRRLHERRELLVLDTEADESLLDYLADIFEDGAPNLGDAPIRAAMDDPPAFFIVGGYPRQLDSLAERIRELGIDVRSVAPTDPQGAWRREVGESILRDSRQIGLFAAVALAALAACVMVSGWMMLPGALALWWLYRRRRQWYQKTYRFEAESVLAGLAGLDGSTAARCRSLLQSLMGSEVQEYLSACLMEYYALAHRLAPRDDTTGSLGVRARATARNLIDQVIDCCEDYAEIWTLLESRREASADLGEEQLAKLRKTEKTLRKQMARMADSLESLRSRTVAATTRQRQAGSEPELERLVAQVDDELEVVGETLTDLETLPVEAH
jgi:hypothetical protein